MYPLSVHDSYLWAGERGLGDIIEVTVVSSGYVDVRCAEYITKDDLLIRAKTNSPFDQFLGMTISRPIWIWATPEGIDYELSRYGCRTRSRRNGKDGTKN